MKKTKIIFSIFTLIIIYFILSMFSKVEARYVKTASVDIDYNTSDYYFDIEVDKTEITSLPATINVTVKNYEGDSYTDNDLQYSLSINNPYLDIEISEDNGILKGGSKKEQNLQITIFKKQEYNHLLQTLNLQFYINKPYTDKKDVPIYIKYKQDIITVDLAEGMIPVKYDENIGWIKTTSEDPEWYDYNNKKWANVVLEDSTFEGQVLDESKPYSMLVYIPRYAYKITSGWHSDKTGTIDIKFIDNEDKDYTGITYDKTYKQAIEGISSGDSMNNFVVHPAFNYGNNNENKLNGIWVGKFESSNTNCTTDIETGQKVTSWRYATINDLFPKVISMNNTGNIYGLSNDVDPHIIKNTEWGMILYLTWSEYGQGTEITMNDNANFLTGGGNYKNNINQTTTGNIYGIYDINGGAWEKTASYVDNEYVRNKNSSQYIWNKALIDTVNEGNTRYADVYEVGISDGRQPNYLANAERYGDAIYEVSSLGYGTTSWNTAMSNFPYNTGAFFVKGSCINDAIASTGLFYSGSTIGGYGTSHSFRIAIPVLK